MPTKLPPRRTGVSRRRSSAHSPSRARPAPISSSGHQWPYQAPELVGGDVAGDHQQSDHADADQDDGADDGGNTRAVDAHVVGLHGVALGLPGIALRAPCGLLLFPVDPPLGLGIVGRIGAACRLPEACWRHVRRYAAHDCPPSESLPKSCE